MKIRIAWIGKTRQPEIEVLTREYLKRLAHYADVEGSALKDESALLKLSARQARPLRYALVLLDSRGKQLSSEEFARWLNDYQDAVIFQLPDRERAKLLFPNDNMDVAFYVLKRKPDAASATSQ